MLKTFMLLLLPVFLIGNFASRPIDEIVNYYGISTELNFNDIKFFLSWSTHPNTTYYKQEYIKQGQPADHYEDMVLLDFVITNLKVVDVVNIQVSSLIVRKKNDPICNYKVIKNPKTGEYLLDFVISESKNDVTSIIEWDAYKYKSYTDKTGHKGVLLFGYSHRVYDDYANDFLTKLKDYRSDLIKKAIAYPFPDIAVK